MLVDLLFFYSRILQGTILGNMNYPLAVIRFLDFFELFPGFAGSILRKSFDKEVILAKGFGYWWWEVKKD